MGQPLSSLGTSIPSGLHDTNVGLSFVLDMIIFITHITNIDWHL